jgi:hypothetical protein
MDAPVLMLDGPLSSYCSGGPDAPGHRTASCSVFSWAAPRQSWWCCPCPCHASDLKDGALVAEMKAERIEADRIHRVAYGF